MKKIIPVLFAFISFSAIAQNKMDFEAYEPPSTLVVPGKPVTKAKFPFIDVHNHQWGMATMNIPALLKQMDELNMKWDPLESTCRHASLSIL